MITCVVFTCNFGPMMLKWRVEAGSGIFAVGASGRSLWRGAHALFDWKSRKYCSSEIGGLSAQANSHMKPLEANNANIQLLIRGESKVVTKQDLQRRYKLMACDKKPLPGTPLSREVTGMKLKSIASGIDGTVGSHSLWLISNGSPPLLAHITVIPCSEYHYVPDTQRYIKLRWRRSVVTLFE